MARQGAATSIRGVVRDAASGRPLPFSVVAIAGQALQRFSDDSGRFYLAAIRPGSLTLTVRHLGFSPRQLRLNLSDGTDTSIVVSLTPLAIQLAGMSIRAWSACDTRALAAPADEAFRVVVDQLRQNAEQYRLLTITYPFAAYMERTQLAEEHDGSLETRHRDTVVFRSDRLWAYRPGQVISQSTDVRSPSDYVMHIPTLDVISDSAFLTTHCFSNEGMDSVGGRALLRIDFRAATSIPAPDVDGSIYLDTASFQIRRTVVRLSRRPRELPFIDSAIVTTDFAEIYPSLSVIARIASRNRLFYPRNPTAPRASIETQTLVSLAWLQSRPGQSPTLAIAGPILARPRQPRVLLAVDSASEEPLAGVQVVGGMADSVAITGADGRAQVNFVADSGAVIVRRIGYAPRTLKLPAASAATETIIRVALSRAVILDTVQVKGQVSQIISPALRGFEERRRLGMGGYFLSDSLLRREENRKLGDVVRSHMPGAMLQEGFHSSIYLMRSPRCVSGGPPQVYLDGVPLGAGSVDNDPSANSASGTGGSSKDAKGPTTRREQNAAVPPFDLSDFAVSNLAGVEYYPDDTSLPVEFNHSSERCGALLLWTRER